MNEECGIAAIYSFNNNSIDNYIYRILLNLQNRGDISTGITIYNPNDSNILSTKKGLGTVENVFKNGYSNNDMAAIGHVRYSTVGINDINYAQPFERIHGRKSKWFSFAFNGQLSNYKALKQILIEKRNYHFRLDSDTEVIMHYLSKEISDSKTTDFKNVLYQLSEIFEGAYNIVFIDANGNLVVSRDPNGYKPLCYAFNDSCFVAASESAALSNVGFKNIKSLDPGHYIKVNNDGYEIKKYRKISKRSTCFFEWIYFSHIASIIDNSSVYKSRYNLGKKIAEEEKVDINKDTVIIPIPDTSKPIADAMGYEMGVKVIEAIIRNRYTRRTFIKGKNDRVKSVQNKYTLIEKLLDNKKLFLIDDSLVRGTTLYYLIKEIRKKYNVKEIHVRIASPPIINTCQYGVDIPTREELFANNINNLEEMAKKLNVDTVKYLSTESICNCINKSYNELCLNCVERGNNE